MNYIKKNPELIIKTDKNDSYKVIDFVDYKIKTKYRIVVHLRLEDFLEIAQVIHPNSIKRVIDKLNKEYNNETICFVLNNPRNSSSQACHVDDNKRNEVRVTMRDSPRRWGT